MKKRIVILDDLEDQNQLFLRLLNNANYKVIITETESHLLDLINSKYPDLVLLSACLKDKDVYLICKKIKLLEIGESIPVIFINRDQKYFDAETMFNAGGADYINYPFSSAEILTKIANQIELQTLRQEIKEKNNQLQKLIPHYQKLKLALEKAKLELANISNKNESSILPDRDYFLQILEKEWLRGARQRSSFGDVSETNISLVLAEITDFQAYQKNHEQELVKNCIDIVSKTLNATVKRPGDLVSHFNEGKFAILLPNTDQEGAKTVAIKINQNLSELQIPHHYSEISEYLSFCFGIATAIPSQALPASVLIDVGENALYTALAQRKGDAIMLDYV
ncbi:diguanylate cyclase [Cyanobacterium aponinum UTEX 3221]|uniref:diguanylate cyclase domain-containing protein n=1 Tax=Cyanobacterium aponinum TaxID=379064 RepID=UPI002B4BDAF7|nr:diguanylate cyclase [Cyanobacterium aponinum]WRL40122.1 diguanylate cyclase [Cyanobacterium aponinum UTEX 3221]